MPIANEGADITVFVAGDPLIGPTVSERLRRAGHDFDPSNASYLVHMYEELGDQFLREVNGGFSGCLIDVNRGRICLFCDRFRMGRLYYREESDRFIFASEAKAILRVTPGARQLDEEGLAQFLAYGCTVADRTLFKSVKMLPPAAQWMFSRGGGAQKRRYFDVGEWEDSSLTGQAEVGAEEFSTIFQNALQSCFAGPSRLGLSLTGGLDTRLILALRDNGRGILPSYTFGGPIGDTRDIAVAKRLATAFHTDHTVLRLGPDFLNDFGRYAERAVYVSDGTTRASGAHEYYLSSLARTIAPVRLTGNYGSEILHGVDTFKPLNLDSNTFVGELVEPIGRAHQMVKSERACPPVTFAAFKDVPWRIAAGISAGEAHLQARTPYLDPSLVKVAYRLVSRPGTAGRVVRDLIRTRQPQLGSIATDRGIVINDSVLSLPLKAASQMTFKIDYLFSDGMPPYLQRMSGLRNLFPWRRHRYLDYRNWWRHECREFVLDVLSDRRTRQRGYLRQNAVTQLADGWLTGGRHVFAELDIILTLELLQRSLFEAGGDT
jgi:asparagine synthase (glutamine-hydrolysing)